MPENPSEPPHLSPTFNSLIGTGFAAVGFRGFMQLFQQRKTRFDFVADLLRHQELHARLVIIAEQAAELGNDVVFAAEPKHKDAPGVRMFDGIQQDAAGLAVIVAELGAAVRMLEDGDVIERAQIGVERLKFLQHLLGDAVYAADGRDDEQVVADADAAVFPAVTLKGQAARRIGDRMQVGHVFIFFLAAQVRFHVMGVHPFAGFDRIGGMADRITVFGDHVAGLEPGKRDFMPLGNIRKGRQRPIQAC